MVELASRNQKRPESQLLWRGLKEDTQDQIRAVGKKLGQEFDPRIALICLEYERHFKDRWLFLEIGMERAFAHGEMVRVPRPLTEDEIMTGMTSGRVIDSACMGVMSGITLFELDGRRFSAAPIILFYRDMRAADETFDPALAGTIKRANEVMDDFDSKIARIPALVNPQGLPLI